MQETFQESILLCDYISIDARTEGKSKVSNLGVCELVVLIWEIKALLLCFCLREESFFFLIRGSTEQK